MNEVRRESLHEGECLSCIKLAARVQAVEQSEQDAINKFTAEALAHNVTKQQLAEAQGTVERLRSTQPNSIYKEPLLACGHSSFWITAYNRCMACRAEIAEQQVARLRVVINTILFQVAQGKVLERDACITAAKQVYEETA